VRHVPGRRVPLLVFLLACSVATPLAAWLFVYYRAAYAERGVRSKVSRVKNDMLKFSEAIEKYYVDNNQYPPHSSDARVTMLDAKRANMQVPSFMLPNSAYAGATLTTPIAYTAGFGGWQYFRDPFAGDRDHVYGYYADTNGWVIFSPGPDVEYDLEWTDYTSSEPQPSLGLLAFSYDPTNGTLSSGDIIRVKQ
jgi:hypothetical protein